MAKRVLTWMAKRVLTCRGAWMGAWMAAALLVGMLLGTLSTTALGQRSTGARLVTVARHRQPLRTRTRATARTRSRASGRRAKAKRPAVSRAQMELAEDMVREAYALGRGLEPRRRMALLTRLLYTMRPETMAAQKQAWAEELFALAQRLPAEEAGEARPVARITPVPATPPLEALNGSLVKEGLAPVKEGLHGAALGAGSRRNAAIATAAARLAWYDSERALAMLDTLNSEEGNREDARTMAARLVFAMYLRHHGAAGAQTLLAHARKWGERGGFPYGASAQALARLSADQDAAEEYFRQVLGVFARGQEGAFGIAEFAELLERAAAMEAISEESAEEGGRAVLSQIAALMKKNRAKAKNVDSAGGLGRAVGRESGAAGEVAAASGGDDTGAGAEAANAAQGADRIAAQIGNQDATKTAAEGGDVSASDPAAKVDESGDAAAWLSQAAQQRLAAALRDVHVAAPKAYAHAEKDWPELRSLRAGAVRVSAVSLLQVDVGLQASFAEVAEAVRERSAPEALRGAIARGLQRVNERYGVGRCAECEARIAGTGAGGQAAMLAAPAVGIPAPDAQSWALVSLSAYASPMTIGEQLKTIDEPFWRAYFLAIAAQQVGEPTRVADPTARRVSGKEEAEPE